MSSPKLFAYRNPATGETGTPFVLCEQHRTAHTPPPGCELVVVSDAVKDEAAALCQECLKDFHSGEWQCFTCWGVFSADTTITRNRDGEPTCQDCLTGPKRPRFTDTNEARIERGDRIVGAYSNLCGNDPRKRVLYDEPGTVLTDLLADLMHWAKARDIPFDECRDDAAGHFEDEQSGEEV